MIAAIIALAAYWLAFELRYMWYLSSDKAALIRIVTAVAMLSIIVLWVFFPSRLAVAAVALAGLGFPPLYDGKAFVSVDWPFALLMVLHAGLLVGATQLRRAAGRE